MSNPNISIGSACHILKFNQIRNEEKSIAYLIWKSISAQKSYNRFLIRSISLIRKQFRKLT
ncbi:hypothetical protein T11_9631 [Trichinella zimbabwensis]|uniref:Uncharacterized protein n=1 Tax=Trichinella zimbabwensis TaxID=268475 RepID=A0A0V1HNI6_9BILA|nr:hypothetical protein T11_9631 [Trichinella zimbabwensis]